jgi:phosphoribosylanthranilate isomerase
VSGSDCLLKICGLTRRVDVEAAVEAGADYLGFIMAPSPRRVSAEEIARITHGVATGIPRVAVLVNASLAEIEETLSTVQLEALQLHGDEDPESCRRIRRRFGLPVIKALRLRRPVATEDPEPAELVAAYGDADFLLIEAYVEGLYGGTGRTADWALAAEMIQAFPKTRFFLSGGLGPENVREALEAVEPQGVDASSGLEAAKRIKDHEKIRLFSEVVKTHDRT